MCALKTFRYGGVHPSENKLSVLSPIEVFPLPKQVSIPVNQNLGAPGVPVVNKGDAVIILFIPQGFQLFHGLLILR